MSKQFIGQQHEKRVKKIIVGLRKSKTPATQAEITKRSKLEAPTVRQILRRMRRAGDVEARLLGKKKKVRVYR